MRSDPSEQFEAWASPAFSSSANAESSIMDSLPDLQRAFPWATGREF